MSKTGKTKARREFFDSRDKYLSFVHTTDEKIRIAFYLAAQLRGVKTPAAGAAGAPFRLLDAGTGEGTVLATFLTALHKKMPHTPIIATGKEISIDDVCILLSYLPDRFAEHKPLVVHLTNMTYNELANPAAVQFTHIRKGLDGGTSHDFGLQLMNMADLIKKHWALDVQDGRLAPKQKVVLTLYRRDQREALRPHLAMQPAAQDFIIAAQPFRLRRPPAQVAEKVVAPLLRLIGAGGRMVLVYSSGRDFTTPLLRLLCPGVQPYRHAAPAKLLAALGKLPEAAGLRQRTAELRYNFINLYLGRREFSLGNILSLWKAVTYVGQISDAEARDFPFNRRMEQAMSAHIAKTKDLSFVNNVIVFSKPKKAER